MTNKKWFYPIQENVTIWLDKNFSRWQNDWQDVIEKEGIVYERYSGVGKDNDFLAVLITITKQDNNYRVYKMIE